MIPDRTTIIKRLIEADLIDQKQVDDVITHCENKKEEVYAELVARINLPAERIDEFFLENFGFQRIVLSDLGLNPALINAVPAHLIITHLIIPVFKINGRVFLAVADPLNIDGLKAIKEYTGSNIGILLSTSEQITRAISEYIFRPKIAFLMK